jgi:ankyrin repeat protein
MADITLGMPTVLEERMFDVIDRLDVENINKDPFNGSTNGTTILIAAAQAGMGGAVDRLLEKPNINPNVTNTAGVTPLIAASMKGHLDIVEKLLEKGADISLKTTSDKHTALDKAIIGMNNETDVEKLKSYGNIAFALNFHAKNKQDSNGGKRKRTIKKKKKNKKKSMRSSFHK